MHMRLISILVKNHKCFAIMQIMSMAKPILCLAMLVYLQNDFVFIIGRVKLQISILRQKFCMVWIFIEQIKAISEPSLPPKIMLNVNAKIKTRSLYEAIVRHGISGQVGRSCLLYTLYPAPASKVLITVTNSIKLRSWLPFKIFCSLVSTVSPGIPHYQHEKEGAFKFHSIQQKLLSCFPTVSWRLEKRGFRCSSYYKF